MYIQKHYNSKEITWNSLKSKRLKRLRDTSFEDIVNAELIDIKEHPKKDNQNIMLFRYRKYIWIVPYIENEDQIFLKTLYPSRKYTKLYKKESSL